MPYKERRIRNRDQTYLACLSRKLTIRGSNQWGWTFFGLFPGGSFEFAFRRNTGLYTFCLSISASPCRIIRWHSEEEGARAVAVLDRVLSGDTLEKDANGRRLRSP